MNDNLRSAQQQLLQEIDGSISDKSILKVLSKVPRQMFVPRKYYYSAYENVPLPIGDDQTISQPLIVCIMIELLELKQLLLMKTNIVFTKQTSYFLMKIIGFLKQNSYFS